MGTLIDQLIQTHPRLEQFDPKSDTDRQRLKALLEDFYRGRNAGDEIASRLLDPMAVFCSIGHQRVGFIIYKFPKNLPKVVYITTLGTDSKERRKGYGEFLLKAFCAQFKDHSQYNQVMLGVRANNPAAIALYKQVGFEVIEKGVDDGVEFLRMSLKL